jgi:hypothetical protein
MNAFLISSMKVSLSSSFSYGYYTDGESGNS